MPVLQVRFLLCLGDMLVSLCDQGRLKAWELKRRRSDRGIWRSDDLSDEATCETSLEGGFVPSALAHPPTYLNKVVVGSENGSLQLWNVRSGRLVTSPGNWCMSVVRP